MKKPKRKPRPKTAEQKRIDELERRLTELESWLAIRLYPPVYTSPPIQTIPPHTPYGPMPVWSDTSAPFTISLR